MKLWSNIHWKTSVRLTQHWKAISHGVRLLSTNTKSTSRISKVNWNQNMNLSHFSPTHFGSVSGLENLRAVGLLIIALWIAKASSWPYSAEKEGGKCSPWLDYCWAFHPPLSSPSNPISYSPHVTNHVSWEEWRQTENLFYYQDTNVARPNLHNISLHLKYYHTTRSPDLVLALPSVLCAVCIQAVWPPQRWPFFTLFLPYVQFSNTNKEVVDLSENIHITSLILPQNTINGKI